ncbi:hypothetical protein PG997_014282 [Apiospora hydei]|uniref:F-box domain-containing protein n=1 Tax=Apiospora hydei TaxID=1337664 RepID=A0ABR1UTC3_9PEZI
MPIEIIRHIGEKLNLRDPTNFISTCKVTHRSIAGQWLINEQVIEELQFDYARLWLYENQLNLSPVINITPQEVARWPQSRAAIYASDDSSTAQEKYACLDYFVERYGAGILYFSCTSGDTFWNRALIRQLPQCHRLGSLINRAITSCSDTSVMQQIMSAYARIYPDALQDFKPHLIRRRFSGYCLNNDPPLFWACSENRVDVLELLNREDRHDDTMFWQQAEMELVTDDLNCTVLPLEQTSEWHVTPMLLIDAWESAFHPRDTTYGRRKPGRQAINEDACLWLLEHQVGFCTRLGGIPIQHLEEAAVLMKTRVLQALLQHFRSTLTVKKYQRAVTLALRAAARGWAGPRPPRRNPITNKDTCPDGHKEVIEILLGAVKGTGPLRQTIDRKDDKGILAHAVRTAPRNALYLLRKQMALGITDYRDVRAALLEALKLDGDRGDARRLQFFGTIFPAHYHLACNPAQLRGGPVRASLEFEGFIKGIVTTMRSSPRNSGSSFMALSAIGWIRRELAEGQAHNQGAVGRYLLTN